jgi:hypothetical protein
MIAPVTLASRYRVYDFGPGARRTLVAVLGAVLDRNPTQSTDKRAPLTRRKSDVHVLVSATGRGEKPATRPHCSANGGLSISVSRSTPWRPWVTSATCRQRHIRARSTGAGADGGSQWRGTGSGSGSGGSGPAMHRAEPVAACPGLCQSSSSSLNLVGLVGMDSGVQRAHRKLSTRHVSSAQLRPSMRCCRWRRSYVSRARRPGSRPTLDT